MSVAKAPAGPRAPLLGSSSAPIPGGEMSGLSHLESEGCRDLLGMLDNNEIMALCDTVTNRLVQPVDRQGRRRQGPGHPRGRVGRGGSAEGPLRAVTPLLFSLLARGAGARTLVRRTVVLSLSSFVDMLTQMRERSSFSWFFRKCGSVFSFDLGDQSAPPVFFQS